MKVVSGIEKDFQIDRMNEAFKTKKQVFNTTLSIPFFKDTPRKGESKKLRQSVDPRVLHTLNNSQERLDT